ncbi:unnamed protein product [Prunus armeniaca]|uniref:Uncharacterized protein n=1 Tax=Prunus armeniaca TaxID=36596 RepID=A0A6J5TP29_PRUAR|nr:unnamed protein product [Prunus armeniaca]CAB4295370.1 unnamed protein product [Prunus armeniaca]
MAVAANFRHPNPIIVISSATHSNHDVKKWRTLYSLVSGLKPKLYPAIAFLLDSGTTLKILPPQIYLDGRQPAN